MMDDGRPLTGPLMLGEQIPPQQQGMVGVGGVTYSIPGVLHFIKHEFVRLEKERANWEVERAELQAKISFLQGERRGHDNLMRDLVRRIKMLEYALKQERLKVFKLQQPGKELVFSDMKTPQFEQEVLEAPSLTHQRESRRILRDYLREVGFPDNVLEARVARINLYRTLTSTSSHEDETSNIPITSVPLTPDNKYSPQISEVSNTGPIPNGTDTEEHPGRRDGSPIKNISDDTGDVKDTTEAMLEASFGFLEDEDSDDEEEREEWEEDGHTAKDIFKCLDRDPMINDRDLDMDTETATEFTSGVSSFNQPVIEDNHSPEDELPIDQNNDNTGDWTSDFTREMNRYRQHKRKSTKVIARPLRSELKRMEQFKNQGDETSNSTPGDLGMGMMRIPGTNRIQGGSEQEKLGLSGLGSSPPSTRRAPHERIEVSLGLDDLAGLSISNEAATGYENLATESVKRWEHKYTMRSHFDVVTCLCFHPVDHVLLSASEDCTLKLWNIQKATQNKKSAIIDVEPVYTFRGHTNPVLSVALSTDGEVVYSGSNDGSIRIWQVPSDLSDPFDVYDSEVHRGVLEGHTDAVWGLVVHPSSGLLASCASDGQAFLWDPQLTSPKLRVFQPEEDLGNPTSLDFFPVGIQQMVVSYNTAKAIVYDIETGQNVVSLDSAVTYDGTCNTQINKVVCHPTLPLIVTGHEDKYIRFFDSKSGKVIDSMIAHTDAVTGLAIDPHGLYLLSGSHDGSLMFWSMDTKTCVQEITAHRKRFDESIYHVTCHTTKPYFASAGADGIAKVFT